MNKIFSCLFICLINISCSAQETKDLVNTKWVYDLGGCQDFIKFKEDNRYEFFSCETQSSIFGRYTQNSGVLTLLQLKGEFDKTFPENSRHKAPKVRFKMTFNEDKLKFIERWEKSVTGKWIKSDFNFPENYLFKEVDSSKGL